jgi:MFS family permease
MYKKYLLMRSPPFSSKINDLAMLNFLYTFLYAALALLLPLYLMKKGLDVAEIGVVFSILPLVMIFARTAFAIIADIIGTRTIFLISGISTVAALIIYLFANSSAMFSFGKVFEGFRASSFWAVSRTEIYRAAENRDEFGNIASLMVGIRMLGDFLARIISGLVIAIFGFFNSLIALLLVGFLYFYYTTKVNNLKHQPKEKFTKEKITIDSIKKKLFAKREPPFWYTSLLASFSAPLDSVLPFLLPLYLLSAFMMSVAEVGLLLALYSLFYAIAALFSVKYKLKTSIGALACFLLIVVPLLLIIYADRITIYAIVALLGLGSGFGSFVYEYVIVKGTRNSKALSTDIAVIHIPFWIAELLAFAAVGFVVSMFGFYVGFVIIGIATILFSVSSLFFLQDKYS